MSKKKPTRIVNHFHTYGKFVVFNRMRDGRRRTVDDPVPRVDVVDRKKFKVIDQNYDALGPHLTMYKTLKNARIEARGGIFAISWSRASGNPEPTQTGIILHFRPEDLEPVDMAPDDRVQFYKDQIEKWRRRLFESGLSNAELQVICEDQMLAWGNELKQYESEAKL
jgi:hypothetical protein